MNISQTNRPGIHRRQPKLTDKSYLVHRKTLRGIEQTIEHYLQDKDNLTLLDVGCGSKPYETIFSSVIERYIGCDPFPGSFADIVCPAEQLTVSANSVDVVFSSSVLEHVENPQMSVSEIYRVLKPNGIAIVTVPAVYVYHPTPEDYWRWTQAGIAKLFHSAPFQQIEVLPTGGTFATIFRLFAIYTHLALVRLERSKFVPNILAKNIQYLCLRFINEIGALLDDNLPVFSDITKPNTLIAGFLVVATK